VAGGNHSRMSDAETGSPDERWRRPDGADDLTVEAVGKVSEALEYIHRVRGCFYELHQLTGQADFYFEDGAEMLRAAGHDELAGLLETEVVGRNLLPGRWTFQIMEEFDDTYYFPVVEAERRIRAELMAGRRHVYESELKEQRRTQGRPAHESRPTDL
jgi:hypothetical protein